ncbi:hypothetical protein CRM22_008608 [Opisthorchis felineus]|nr:hypothetical protein CRM22_008608 [Opisthorchis felineus]
MHKSQPIYDETTEIPIVLASPTRRNVNGAFQYTLNGERLGPKIQVTMEAENKNSLLRSALCIQNLRLSSIYKMTAKNQTDWLPRQIGLIINRAGMELKATSRLINTEVDTDRCERMESWRVSVEGWVTEKPAYLDLLVEKQIPPSQGTDNVESGASLSILKQDILLLPGLQQQTWNKPPNLKETQHPFILELDLAKITKGLPVANRTYTINIQLRDCAQNYHLETNLGDDYVSSASSQETDRPPVHGFSKPPKRMWKIERLYLPFILICIVIGLLYLVLLTAYCLVRVCSGTSKHSSVVAHYRATRNVPSVSMSSSTSLLSGATTQLQGSEPMTAARKVLIMVYLCFRVFYTFLFTISVGLSLILSIESNSARDFAAALYSNAGQISFSYINGRLPPRPSPYVVTPTEVENRWWESNSWMFEAARMEDFSHSELLRQTQIMNKQIAECGDQMSLSNLKLTEMIHLFGSQIRSWLNPKSETIGLLRFQVDVPTEPVVGKDDVKAHDTQQMWATNPVYGNFLPVHRSTWKLLEQANWMPYLDTVDVHLQKIRDLLDTEVIDQWTPFDRLLNNLLVNNWIAPARRSMNTSWTRVGDAPTSETGLFGMSDSEYYSENIDTSASDPMNQKRHREARALKLANFIGVPQPAHARLSGARIWNSFRSQVFGLPTYFHYDISGTLDAGESEPHKAKFTSMRYYDKRYMLSNEDWQHVSGGLLEGGKHTIQRHIQHAKTGRFGSQMRPNVATTSGAYSSSNYFLSLTQVRLLLLLLDAVIILARCCQTYRFLQRFWFGKLKRVSMDTLHAEVPLPLNNINDSKGSAVRTSNEVATLQTSYISDRSPLTWSDSDGYTPHIRDSSVPILGVEPLHQGIQQPDLKKYRQLKSTVSFGRTGNHPLPGLRHRPGDVGSYMDGSQGRLTACYCCLDSHYLLIIVGIGLLILGIVLLWVTDRHVRTGWLLARTGLIVRTGALEDCRLRTNSILKNAQTNYWNKQVRFVAREAFRRDAHRIKQMIRRIQHERLQIYQGYLSELCTVDRTRQNLQNIARKANPSSAYPPTIEAFSMSEPTSCSLFDATGQLKNSVQNHISEQFHGSNPQTTDVKVEHGFPQIPSCVFTPIVPATYAEGQSSRILRLTKSRDVLWRGNVSFVSATNQSKYSRFKSDDPLPEELGMALSTGSLTTLLNACQRLILTGLTVTLAMVGFLACLQLAKFLAQRLLPIRTRKVLLVTTHPVHPANPSCFETI